MASSVDLGKKLESRVEQLVKSGRFNSRSEVIREGVRLIDEREARLAELDALLAEGIAAADAGDVHDIDEVFDRLERKYSEMAEAQKRKRA